MEKLYFWADETLTRKLRATIPKRERSVFIRIALRDKLGLTDSKNGKFCYTEDDLETAIERSDKYE